jgi:hypothetical protein
MIGPTPTPLLAVSLGELVAAAALFRVGRGDDVTYAYDVEGIKVLEDFGVEVVVARVVLERVEVEEVVGVEDVDDVLLVVRISRVLVVRSSRVV